MPIRLSRARLLASFALAFLMARPAWAQFTDPRNYENFPVGVNQVELNYDYVRANESIDPSMVIEGAHLNLNQWNDYLYALLQPVWANGVGCAGHPAGRTQRCSVSGTNVSGSVGGAGDSGYEFTWLLKGGPALSPAEFGSYKPTTVVGVSLNVTAPTGLYRADKILNLGSDRWSFRPEIGVSYPFGRDQKWTFDAYANCYFYTDNTSYRGAEVLRQGPLPGFEGHISYTFGERVVASLDTRYSFRGDTIGQWRGARTIRRGTSFTAAKRLSSLNDEEPAHVHL